MTPYVSLMQLLELARQGRPEALGQLLEARRAHARQLVERQLRNRLLARIGASDVVQQAFLEAHRAFETFQGHTEAEWCAWLDRVVERALVRTLRDHTQLQKRDLRRERSLDAE